MRMNYFMDQNGKYILYPNAEDVHMNSSAADNRLPNCKRHHGILDFLLGKLPGFVKIRVHQSNTLLWNKKFWDFMKETFTLTRTTFILTTKDI